MKAMKPDSQSNRVGVALCFVDIEGSLNLHHAWRERGRLVELHVFERGGYGLKACDARGCRWTA